MLETQMDAAQSSHASQRNTGFVKRPDLNSHVERSVALMIARELLKEIVKRDAQTRLPG